MTDISIGLPAEKPVGVAIAGGSIQGVLATPEGQPALGVVMASGGGYPQVAGRNRHWVRLADTLAANGVASYRFAYHGVGDSAGSVSVFDLAQPFTSDLEAAIGVVQEAGAARTAVIGWCFGARAAVEVAPAEIDHLVLLSPPWRDSAMGAQASDAEATPTQPRPAQPITLARIRVVLSDRDLALRALRKGPRMVLSRIRNQKARPAAGDWYSTRMVDCLIAHLENGAGVTIIYGTEDLDFEDFQRVTQGGEAPELKRALELAADQVQILRIDGPVHDLATLESQKAVVDVVAEILIDLAKGGNS